MNIQGLARDHQKFLSSIEAKEKKLSSTLDLVGQHTLPSMQRPSQDVEMRNQLNRLIQKQQQNLGAAIKIQHISTRVIKTKQECASSSYNPMKQAKKFKFYADKVADV